MAYKKNITNLTEWLGICMAQQDPMLYMLEWLCIQRMEAEVNNSWEREKTNVQMAGVATAPDNGIREWGDVFPGS